ncbi:hypothetical protein AN6154.2 [Aspergillus nidulans FGSC A4]|uniref:C6 finger domain protein, putative (AFU_orthologue AFUA_8G01940) n=1 Tax=Emericella nidulans (strain FGSC A4 / ATCC 38163 / CBS 112.46 / NRRL 194 / M139) TaxID=227321 RepID=Q5AZX6_EMENI|nr:hypothetical protein [Aspergillus nidulans FGSC A4]EAA57940.1 hypothetical protein AN6154.2 [Aspergillus nidulans FGSC A4]CBF70076.1 TPA: C6 finger domain protein, putative (AFU_orthologue; AFUA_8G01940) [Aspergillus nidulans FGSC A4]|eukprot:XP_663758.1 hypothetical protein AN6154.2 [Aspergillus nidulans FGSC A4]
MLSGSPPELEPPPRLGLMLGLFTNRSGQQRHRAAYRTSSLYPSNLPWSHQIEALQNQKVVQEYILRSLTASQLVPANRLTGFSTPPKLAEENTRPSFSAQPVRIPNNRVSQFVPHPSNCHPSTAAQILKKKQDPSMRRCTSSRRYASKPTLAPRLPADNTLAPNLATQALDLQCRVLLEYLFKALTPHTLSTYKPRVELTLIDYIQQYPNPLPAQLLWATRCLATLHSSVDSTPQPGTSALVNSRRMYQQAIRHLLISLYCPRSARSDETLTAAMLLCVYEMIDRTNPEAWMIHSRGITNLLRIRGPKAHRSGIGQTLLLCLRPILVAQALTRAEPCLLGEPAWRKLGNEMMRSQKGAEHFLNTWTECSFGEIAMCPGLLARTQAILSDPGFSLEDEAITKRKRLLTQITSIRTALRTLNLQIELEFGKYDADEKSPCGLRRLSECIPPDSAERFVLYLHRGIQVGAAMLDQLVTLLVSDDKRRCQQETSASAALKRYYDTQDSTGVGAKTIPRTRLDATHLPTQTESLAIAEDNGRRETSCLAHQLDILCMSQGMIQHLLGSIQQKIIIRLFEHLDLLNKIDIRYFAWTGLDYDGAEVRVDFLHQPTPSATLQRSYGSFRMTQELRLLLQ